MGVGLNLLRRAQDAGLRIEAVGDRLVVRGPKRSESVVKLLAEHRTEVLAALAGTKTGIELMPSHRFERFISRSDCEPRLELPCIARRGRVQELAGALLHFCTFASSAAPMGHLATAFAYAPVGRDGGTAPSIDPRDYEATPMARSVPTSNGVAFLSWNQHPEPTGSRRATPLLLFQHSPGQFPPRFGRTLSGLILLPVRSLRVQAVPS